jgi:hypothetical protein
LTHAEVQERLPWYVNATLPADERAGVDEHLASCPQCTREREDWEALAAAARDVRGEPPLPSLWHRIRLGWARFWGPLPAAARLAFAVPYAVALVLALVWLLRPAPETRFETASDPGQGVRVVIGFAEGVSEADLRRTVREVQGTIVSGPSALGLYVVEVPLRPEKTDEIEALLVALRGRRGVVSSAERKH